MSIKIFSFKGLNGMMTILSIVIPVVTWLVEKARKNNFDQVMYEKGRNIEKKIQEKSA